METCRVTPFYSDLITIKNNRIFHEENLLSLLEQEAIATLEKSKYEESVDILQKLLAINPQNPLAWHNLGYAYSNCRQYKEAILAYQNAIKLHPDFVCRIQWNLSYCFLILGQFHSGFKAFESRLEFCKTTTLVPNLHIAKKWEGENISGKTLLVHHDGGLGDTIHFLRYIPFLKRYNCKILLFLQPELNCLFENLDVELVNEEKIHKYDMYVFMMSLPYCFNTQISTIPNPVNITARCCPIKGRIGIIWKSNGRVEKNLQLEQLAPIFSIPRCEYFCIQKEVSKENNKLLIDYKINRPIINSFSDTIKILETCHIVITIDTSVAHLAASMNIPTYLLIDYNPCWRWLIDRRDCPWYPSVRLFRQKKMNDWKDPIQELEQQIRTIIYP